MCLWSAYPPHAPPPSGRGDSAPDVEVPVDSVQRWLCALGSYRYIQVKMRVYMQALDPTLCLSLLKDLDQGPAGRSVAVSRTRFVAAVEASGAPLSRAEAQALGGLLMRHKSPSTVNMGTGGRRSKSKSIGDGGWSWLRDEEEASEYGREGERIDGKNRKKMENVEVALLDNICKGNFLSAIL